MIKRKFCCAMAVALTALTITSYSQPILIPWFTGPLLAPAGHVVPVGHTNWEPYLFVNDAFGHYGSHSRVIHTPPLISTTPEMSLTQGVVDNVDFQTIIPYHFNTKENKYTSGSGDIQLILGFQALQETKAWWHPNLRVTLVQTVPVGTYENLSSVKLGTDQMGSGSNQIGLGATFEKSVHYGDQIFRWRVNVGYDWPFKVNVRGFNAYGGGIGTNGTVTPGNVFHVDIGLEYTLTQHWVPALDITYRYVRPDTFSGVNGVKETGEPATNVHQTSYVYTLAPGIEYNFNANVGVIAGAWFSVKGKNSADFDAFVCAVNVYV